MERPHFTFYKEWRDAAKDLPNDIRAEIYEAIIEYALTGMIPAGMKPIAGAAFKFVKEKIDKDYERYKALCERNRTNGAKSKGRPKIEKSEETQENPKKPKKPTGLSGLSEEDIPPTPPKEENNRDSDESLSTDVDAVIDARDEFDEVMNYFNSLIDTYGSSISKIRVIQSERRKLLSARLKQYGLESTKEAIKNAVSSDFLNGQGSKGFIASFDWIIKPNNFIKVLEGNYNNKQNKNAATQTTQRDRQDDGHPTDSELHQQSIGIIERLRAERHARNAEVRK